VRRAPHVCDAAWDADRALPRAVLDWVMIYWVSRAGPAASLRIYWERKHAPAAETALLQTYLGVPYGVSFFPKEINQPPIACAFPVSSSPVRRALTHAASARSVRTTTSCSRASTRAEGILPRTSSRTRSSATCARCSGRTGRHTALYRARMATEERKSCTYQYLNVYLHASWFY
jgi:hypothetical protein